MVGATGSGKTEFVKQLLEKNQIMVDPPFDKKIVAYGEWQPAYENMKGVEFVRGLSEEVLKRENLRGHTIIVIDDLADEIDSKLIGNLFTKYSHHRNLSVCFLLNNLFFKGLSTMRLVSLNTHYLCLFRSARDQNSIETIGRQMFGKAYKYMLQAYHDATKKKYGYLIVDSKADSDPRIRLRTQVFPPNTPVCYVIPYGQAI